MKYLYKTCLTLLLLLSAFVSVGQNFTIKNKKAIREYQFAVESFGKGQIKSAEKLLQNAIKYEENFIEAYLVLGDLYNNSEQYEKEAEALKKAYAIDSTFFPITALNIGIAEFYSENYLDAIEWINIYKKHFLIEKNKNRVEEWLEKAKFAQELMEKEHRIELFSMGDSINSLYDEYWPSLTADERFLIFTVLEPRDKELFKEIDLPKTAIYFEEEFYFSENIAGVWSERKKLPGKINTNGNEGAQTLSADGNWMFFTACNREDGRGSCDIYFSQKIGEEWGVPVNLGAPVNSPYWESQPSFSSDGKTLYFTSNRPGGIGGKDIWQATIMGFKSDGTPIFGNVICLDKNINTAMDEISPFIHPDNKTLYYSSDGKPGMGGLDIFMSVKGIDGKWQPAENVGYPINTAKDEMAFIVNARGDRAYFSSDRAEDEKNSKSIYWFDLPEDIRPNPVIYVKGTVFDAETKEILNADFQLYDVETAEGVVTSKGNEKTGEFLVCLPLGGKYSFFASHPGYMFYSGHFDIEQNHPLDKTYELDIALMPIKKGARITLKNIFFESDSYNLKNESKAELDRLIEFMTLNKNVRIEISGHTDNVGNADYNKRLSENRAKEVRKYLSDNDIEDSRMEHKGFGMTQPIEDNDTEEGRANNRRTEILVL